ncbi:Myosin-15 [Fukomys damarensis]|uniref:Myosin-15 n=1 Tax=Fukomys damarensis TaxID=885580 RepID=A0A091DKJ5_FUKDA|nr:Myosin-15 [Fukomys damarensis]
MILHIQLELLEAKVELEKKLSEKEEELENFRRKQQCTIDALQSSLDSEARSRTEATWLKRMMKEDLKDMELQLCSANYQASERIKSLGQLQSQTKDLQVKMDDHMHLNSALKEQVAVNEQHNSLLQSELEELRSLQEQADCRCKLVEKELLEATHSNTSRFTQKKKLEADVAQMQKDSEEMVQVCQNAEEKTKKAAFEAANMSEELKKEQDINAHLG